MNSCAAAGAGLNVLFAQFIKAGRYSEIVALERYDDRITVRQYGRGCFIRRSPDPADVAAFLAGGFANPAASCLRIDALVSVACLFLWMFPEGRRLGMRNVWAYAALTFLVAMAMIPWLWPFVPQP